MFPRPHFQTISGISFHKQEHKVLPETAAEGEVVEFSPDATQITKAICDRIEKFGGLLLVITSVLSNFSFFF
jgi:SAM-dependent MidA family methyltransferase